MWSRRHRLKIFTKPKPFDCVEPDCVDEHWDYRGSRYVCPSISFPRDNQQDPGQHISYICIQETTRSSTIHQEQYTYSSSYMRSLISKQRSSKQTTTVLSRTFLYLQRTDCGTVTPSLTLPYDAIGPMAIHHYECPKQRAPCENNGQDAPSCRGNIMRCLAASVKLFS